MWVVFVVLTYFVLALLIPVCWSLGRVWWNARRQRTVRCPAAMAPATVRLDALYAARMHALGNREIRVLACSEWPANRGCDQACLPWKLG